LINARAAVPVLFMPVSGLRPRSPETVFFVRGSALRWPHVADPYGDCIQVFNGHTGLEALKAVDKDFRFS
jgi:hypothetical protein